MEWLGQKKPVDFKRATIFTDIHLGLRHNSRTHNQDCLDFIDFMCAWSKENGNETAIFMGDWHHHRNQINVSTLNYTQTALKRLNDSFEQVFFIVGNHDLFYRDKRDVHSVPMAELYPNIFPVDKIVKVGKDITFVPWLVENEWKKVKNIKSRYIFGHFEIPGFRMNNIVDVPDHGEINRSHFKHAEKVFSGHLHKRQVSDNIYYIGNCFPHDFGDAGDFDRGFASLEFGGEVEFVNWAECPKFIRCNLSDIAQDPEQYLLPKSYIKATADVELSYEEITNMKEVFQESHNVREFRMVAAAQSVDGDDTLDEAQLTQSIDEIITSQIDVLDSETYDKNMLLSIYGDLG